MFMAQHPPFDLLPPEILAHASQNLEISYYRAGTTILNYGDRIHHLFIVRSGVVEVYRRNGELYHRLDDGELFGHIGLLMSNRVRFPAKAISDTLIYALPESIFIELCHDYDFFSDFVEADDSTRIRLAVSAGVGSNMTSSKINNLLTRDAVILSAQATVREAAQTMADENVSAVLIIDTEILGNQGQGRYVGILTDRDLCTKVLASGLPSDSLVQSVMSTELLSLDHNAYVFEAMLTMLRNNVHHLPVLRDNHTIGIIEVTDIIRHESQSSLLLVNTIFLQPSVDELAGLAAQVKSCFNRMVNEDANSHMIGSAISVIGRSFMQRLAELGEEKYGPPPISYCILTLGSMARDEQMIVTDQDNALILAEEFDPERQGGYFKDLTTFICDGLAACGYAYCSGGIMATNPEWQKTLSQWKECFAGWIDEPKPEALLNSSIFFDLDGVYGHTDWAEQLKNFFVEKAYNNNRFLACLARNALNRTPPLGFFKNLVMEKDGRHKNSINLKRRGTAPLTDVIRVHSLAVGSRVQNSFERLDDIIKADILPEKRGPDLRDAMEFISMVRIRHQALNIESGLDPDNNIEPENMSNFERRNLKDAFQILSNAQSFLKYRYSASQL